MQNETSASPDSAETPLKIPGFDVYSTIIGILLLMLIFRSKKKSLDEHIVVVLYEDM